MAGTGEYQRGTMDITAQRKTYAGVMKASMWGVFWIVVLLILMALFLL
ncbi:aa3-type cytochrome c oxidase subunit IV [Marinibaculum pumilum]|uniref:Aa3-type cytochrome c oxidase subunit IV n=1 Tax=Marinibaculum pumilum TaxID=1766165 RepID=A0ABV7L7D6_9PROT